MNFTNHLEIALNFTNHLDSFYNWGEKMGKTSFLVCMLLEIVRVGHIHFLMQVYPECMSVELSVVHLNKHDKGRVFMSGVKNEV